MQLTTSTPRISLFQYFTGIRLFENFKLIFFFCFVLFVLCLVLVFHLECSKITDSLNRSLRVVT